MNTKMVIAAAALLLAFAAPALAQTALQQPRQQHSVNPSYDVYKNGQYLGADPDPNIRALMQRAMVPQASGDDRPARLARHAATCQSRVSNGSPTYCSASDACACSEPCR